MKEVNINLGSLGGMFLLNPETGERDIIGSILSAEGVPDEVLSGYVSPAELAQAILIHREVPVAKDHHVMILNTFLKPDSTFTTRPEAEVLMKAQDEAIATGKIANAGEIADPTVLMELRALAYVLGYKINFIHPIEPLDLELYNVGD